MKTIKKILISSLSILGISFSIWILFLLNPQLSYAHQTQFSQVTVFHNLDLEEGTEAVIEDALRIVQSAEIYDDQLNIQLCLNDDKYYPHLHPFAGGNAYAYFDKTVMFACDDNFDKNETRFRWAINDYELRKFNLTQLLAHEFMHNYQSNFDAAYYVKNTLGKINWKLEGHAEYIARGYKSDGLLKEKLAQYLFESSKVHVGIPVFELEDGTIHNLAYFKYSILIQYLMEIKGLNFEQLCKYDKDVEQSYTELLQWAE